MYQNNPLNWSLAPLVVEQFTVLSIYEHISYRVDTYVTYIRFASKTVVTK